MKFGDLAVEPPISKRTLDGLREGSFVEMTPIQQEAIPVALAGKDLLGTARTGSGKTIAFLVPLLETLHRSRWSKSDALGALVLAPTRELASQIFQVLTRIGAKHGFSAGLLIGGRSFEEERRCVTSLNILIATPGRLLQHLEQSRGLQTDNLQILVLDEADRLLDLGFKPALDAIVSALPSHRQTLLFSATLTASVKQLARLSLKEPTEISLASRNGVPHIPEQLEQHWSECGLAEKLSVAFAFLRSHTKSKILLFLSSCKQVRFVYEAFCHLQPGIPLLCLHGKQKQQKRGAVFAEFRRKQFAALMATDIAARGLDFPFVDWVVQIDAPEDVATYVHRVGRTARYEARGHSLLLLTPQERGPFLKELKDADIAPDRLEINPSMAVSIRSKLGALLAADPSLKYLAQRCVVSYARSIFLMKNKKVFDASQLPIKEFAEAIGLPIVPKVRFLPKSDAKNLSRSEKRTAASDGDSDSESSREDEGDFLRLKRKNHEIDTISENLVSSSKKALSRATHKKERLRGLHDRSHLLFDEDGSAADAFPVNPEAPVEASEITTNIKLQSEMLSSVDLRDKQVARDKRKEKRLAEKKKLKNDSFNQE